MDEANGWARRVDQMTLATSHEQLRSVVREVEEALQRLSREAFEQYGVMVTAQRELEADLTRRVSDLAGHIHAEIDTLRGELFVSIAALGERLEEDARRIDAFEQKLDGVAEALARIGSVSEDRHGVLLGQLGRIADMEDRMASRMVNLLFAAARRIKSGSVNDLPVTTLEKSDAPQDPLDLTTPVSDVS